MASAARKRHLAAVLISLVITAEAIFTDLDIVNPSHSSGFSWRHLSGITPSTRRAAFTAVLATWSDATALSIGLPPPGQITPKSCSSGLTQNASVTAARLGCTFATNGGYFGGYPTDCVGNFVANNTVLQLQNAPATNFALLRNGSLAFGYASHGDLPALANQSAQLVSGKGWLVRRGEVNWNASQDLRHPSAFAEEYVPRTALGVFRNGSMLLLVVNGIELAHQGVSLAELSQLMVDMGVWQAVNLDGGGSSDAVFRGEVVSKPTCSDTAHVCERPIVSIMCVGGTSTHTV